MDHAYISFSHKFSPFSSNSPTRMRNSVQIDTPLSSRTRTLWRSFFLPFYRPTHSLCANLLIVKRSCKTRSIAEIFQGNLTFKSSASTQSRTAKEKAYWGLVGVAGHYTVSLWVVRSGNKRTVSYAQLLEVWSHYTWYLAIPCLSRQWNIYHLFIRITHMTSNINMTLICHRYIMVTLEINCC